MVSTVEYSTVQYIVLLVQYSIVYTVLTYSFKQYRYILYVVRYVLYSTSIYCSTFTEKTPGPTASKYSILKMSRADQVLAFS